MSFSPPTPPNPNQGSGGPLGGPPRSTPIPGTSTPIPGSFGAAPPPTPTEFFNTPTDGTFQAAPGGAFGDQPKRSRSWGPVVLMVLVFGLPIAGMGVGVWAWLRGRDDAERADQLVDEAQASVDSVLQQAQDVLDSLSVPAIPVVTLPGVTLPGVTVPGASVPAATTPAATTPAVALSLFAEGGAPAVMAAFDAAISGEPTRYMQVILYPDYAFATAQDANIPTHVDEFPWRDGVVGASSPVTLVGSGDLEAALFAGTDVDWAVIARAIAEAPALANVEEGAVSHVIVDRSVFTDDFAVVVRVYVTGPRGSAYLNYTPTGEFIEVVS